ncbi:MAG: hypothetical protein ACI4OJ_06805 [Lachnospiraceae bacterium]
MALVSRAVLLAVITVLVLAAAGLAFRLLQRLLLSLLSLFLGSGAAAFVLTVLTFPGTIHHELSHALAAVLSGSRVTSIRLLPAGQELGSVTIIPPRGFFAGSLSRTLTAFAPVFLGCLSLFGLIRAALPRASTTAAKVLVWYLAFSILLHMDLSGADFRAAAKGAPGFLALLVLLYLILLAFFPALSQALPAFSFL